MPVRLPSASSPALVQPAQHRLLPHDRREAEEAAAQRPPQLGYRVVELLSLERIVWLCMSQQEPPLPQAEVDDRFRERPAYLEGHLTDEPDLSIYDRPADDADERHSQPDDTPDEPQPPESEDQDG